MILSVQKAMRILTILANMKNKAVSLMEISNQTGYPKSTCSHILDTLCQEGYVVRVSHSEGYTLGLALYNLTRYRGYDRELVTLCQPVMRWMERKSQGTVILSVIQNNQKFIIDYADSVQKLFEDHPQIRLDDIYRTATGRAILAHMDKEHIKAFWNKYGNPPPGDWDEITSYDTLITALNKLRQQSIVKTCGMNQEGEQRANGYACPLFKRRNCIGAIGIALRLPEQEDEAFLQRERQICSVLLKGAKEIQRRLTYEE